MSVVRLRSSHLCCNGAADDTFEVGRGTGWVRTAEKSDYVSSYLDGGEDQAPRKAPPPAEKREEGIPELTFATARPARDLRPSAPGCKDQERPDFVGVVHVDRAATAALRATALMQLSDLGRYEIGWQLAGDSKPLAIALTLVITEPQVTISYPSEEDCRSTSLAFSHNQVLSISAARE
jgi:hypothetical protein